LILADCLFPPYLLVLEAPSGRQYGQAISRGHRFLLTEGFNRSAADFERSLGIKTPSPNSQYFFTRINYRLLAIQILVVAFVTAVGSVVTTLMLRGSSGLD